MQEYNVIQTQFHANLMKYSFSAAPHFVSSLFNDRSYPVLGLYKWVKI